MTTALVAGGAGFIGSHLCERLLDDGIEVYCVDNLITGSKENIRHLITKKTFDFSQEDVIEELASPYPVSMVFNLASPASPVDYLKYPLETLAVGSVGTWNLLEFSREEKASFLTASTSEVYGDPHVHPQVESYWGNVNPIGPRSVYDEAKRFSEAVVMQYNRMYNHPTRIVRIFNTYGPRMRLDDGRVVPTLIGQALREEPLTIFGDGSQTRSFCYVSDLVDGLVKAIKSNDPNPVNLGNPEEHTILEFAEIIQKLTGTKSKITFKPLPQDDPKVRKPDITRARQLLGWEPKVSLEDGLSRTITYFRRGLL